MVQSYEDKKRYERLGVEKTKLITYKNLKYSIGYEKLDEERKKNYFAHNLIAEKKKIVCGSTRPGEEEIWLEVFKEINVDKEYQLVIVPRHLERIREIEAMIEKIYGSPASGLYREENKRNINNREWFNSSYAFSRCWRSAEIFTNKWRA